MAPDESRGTPRRGPEEPTSTRGALQTGFQSAIAAVRRAVGSPTRTDGDEPLEPAPDRRPTPPGESPPEAPRDGEPAPAPQSRRPSRRPQPRRPRTDEPRPMVAPPEEPPTELPTEPPTGDGPSPATVAAAATIAVTGPDTAEHPVVDGAPPEPGTKKKPPPPRRPRLRRRRLRARKVKRVVRHVDPWSALKISLLFYLAIFLIVMVAGVLLWRVARNTGAVEDSEDFITDIFSLGECELTGGATSEEPEESSIFDQDDEGTSPEEVPVDEDSQLADADENDEITGPRDEDGCLPGRDLTGTFKFEGEKIFQGFVLGGLVLVVAGAAFNVVLVILFNLISDLTGGVRVTVLEEESVPVRPRGKAKPTQKRPPRRPRGSPPKPPPDQVATDPAQP